MYKTKKETNKQTNSDRIIPYDHWFDYQNQARTVWVFKISTTRFSHKKKRHWYFIVIKSFLQNKKMWHYDPPKRSQFVTNPHSI